MNAVETTIGFPNQKWNILNTEERHNLNNSLNSMSLLDLRMIYNQLTYITQKHPVKNQRRKDEWKTAIRAMTNRVYYSSKG